MFRTKQTKNNSRSFPARPERPEALEAERRATGSQRQTSVLEGGADKLQEVRQQAPQRGDRQDQGGAVQAQPPGSPQPDAEQPSAPGRSRNRFEAGLSLRRRKKGEKFDFRAENKRRQAGRDGGAQEPSAGKNMAARR